MPEDCYGAKRAEVHRRRYYVPLSSLLRAARSSLLFCGSVSMSGSARSVATLLLLVLVPPTAVFRSAMITSRVCLADLTYHHDPVCPAGRRR